MLCSQCSETGPRRYSADNINREESGDSYDSIGDLPIELPHLEGELGGNHQKLWPSFVLERRRHDPNFTLNGKSKSLDDLMQQSTGDESKSTCRQQTLQKMSRAFTMEDQVRTMNHLGKKLALYL